MASWVGFKFPRAARFAGRFLIAFALSLALFAILYALSQALGGVSTLVAQVLVLPASGLIKAVHAAAANIDATASPTSAVISHALTALSDRLNSLFVQLGISAAISGLFVARLEAFKTRILPGPPEWLDVRVSALDHNDPARHPQLFHSLDALEKTHHRRAFQALCGSDEHAICRIAEGWLSDLRPQWVTGRLVGGHIPLAWVPAQPTAIFIEKRIESIEQLKSVLSEVHQVLKSSAGSKVRILLNTAVDFDWVLQRRDAELYNEMKSFLPHIGDSAATGGARMGESTVAPASRSRRRQALQPVESGARDETDVFLPVPATDPSAVAEELVDKAVTSFGSDGLKLMALASISAPVSSGVRTALAPNAGDVRSLATLFKDQGYDIEYAIPPVPGKCEFATLVRSLDRMQRSDRAEFIASLMDVVPEAEQDLSILVSRWMRRVPSAMANRRRVNLWSKPSAAPTGDLIGVLGVLRPILSARCSEKEARKWFPADFDDLVAMSFARSLMVDMATVKDALASTRASGVQKADHSLGGGRVGLILAEAHGRSRAPFEPQRHLMEALTARIPNLLRSASVEDRSRILQFLAASHPEIWGAEVAGALAESAWIDDVEELANSVSIAFDLRNAADPVQDMAPPPINQCTSAERGRRALALMDASLQAYKAETSFDWDSILRGWEADLDAMLDSHDLMDQFAGAWAIYAICGANHVSKPHRSLTPRLAAKLIKMAANAGVRPATWRRIAWCLARSVWPEDLNASILHWATTIDRGVQPTLRFTPPPTITVEMQDVLSEAGRRLEADSILERIAAAALLLSFGAMTPEVARTIGIAVRRTDIQGETRQALLALMAHDGSEVARRALASVALEGRGQAQTIAFMALSAMNAARELESLVAACDLRTLDVHRKCIEVILGPQASQARNLPPADPHRSLFGRLSLVSTVTILLVRGEDANGNPIWAYVGVRADMLQEFMSAQAEGLFFPDRYGVLIESGTGLQPPPEVQKRMEDDYGFNHQGMLELNPEDADKVAEELSRQANEPTQPPTDP